MNYNNLYDTQRALNSPIIYNYGDSPINNVGNVGMNFATNDPSAFCLSGNAYSIKMKGDQVAAQGLTNNIKSLRINLSGSVLHSFNMCCWIATIILGSIFLFPLFFICCDWWKRKTFQTFTTDPAGYEGVAKLIQYSGAQEIYLTLQDNYFNQGKAHILMEAISRSRIQNVTIMNVVPGFDTLQNNYSQFQNYMRPILQYVKFAQISWGRKFVR